MWPEPKDLAFVVAAAIAGLFSFVVSLNSKESSIVAIREKWLEQLKNGIAEFLALYRQRSEVFFNLVSIIRIQDDLRSAGDIDRVDEEQKRFDNVLVEHDKNILKQRELVYKLGIELSASDDHTKALLLELNSALDSVNELVEDSELVADVGVTEKFSEVSSEHSKRISKFAKEAYKKEWSNIRSGDREISRQRWICNGVIVLIASVYLGYVLTYYSHQDISQNDAIIPGKVQSTLCVSQ